MSIAAPSPPFRAFVAAALVAPLIGGLLAPANVGVSRPFIVGVAYLFGLPLTIAGLLLVAAPIAFAATKVGHGLPIAVAVNGAIATAFGWGAVTATWPMLDAKIMIGAGGAAAAVTFSIVWLIYARKVSHA